MWTTLLILAVALNLEPNRLGIIGLLLLRPRPIRQLLVFLCTSFVTTSVAGLTVLYLAYRGSFLQGESSSAIMQISVGAVALIAAAVLFTNIPLPGSKRPVPAGSVGVATGADPKESDPAESGPTESEAIQSSGMGLVDNFTKRLGKLAHGDSAAVGRLHRASAADRRVRRTAGSPGYCAVHVPDRGQHHSADSDDRVRRCQGPDGSGTRRAASLGTGPQPPRLRRAARSCRRPDGHGRPQPAVTDPGRRQYFSRLRLFR